MNQSMQVWIYACQFTDDPAYQGSALSLPADQEAVRDAFQRARLKEGEPYLLERGRAGRDLSNRFWTDTIIRWKN
ncbi:MAG: hypothetical protein ACLR7G_11040 [[Clostridium] symbiosum]